MRSSSSAIILTLAVIALSACSSGGTSSSTAPAGGGGAVGKPHYGGTLKIASISSADTLLSIYAHTEGAGNDLSMVYDPLVNVDDKFNVVPWLATKWETSADGKAITFHLRHDATWSDGVPITAGDQVFEYKVTTNPASSAPYKSDYDEVLNCTAPDKWTVVYTLKNPDASFIANVVGTLPHAPLPEHIYGKYPVTQLRHLDLTKHFVASGPYIVSDWKLRHLSAPPRGYHWVQADDRYVLAAIATGVIADIVITGQR